MITTQARAVASTYPEATGASRIKILYGVQGTGNGHISRARAMAKAMSQHPALEVDWLFSGRSPNQFFDMEPFGDYQWRRGLTFVTRKGRVNYLHTALQSHPAEFVRDCRQLDLSRYDLIISDFEPVTAWAGRTQRREVLGIGHQYAFSQNIPRAGDDAISSMIMRHFAPAATSAGLHWHHFGQNILPPIVDIPKDGKNALSEGGILVYLPFEDPAAVMQLLKPHRDFRFQVYHPLLANAEADHIATRALSATEFKRDLEGCQGVICNAGFELISEALSLGKKILAKPLARQMEQLSNARALQQLGYASIMERLDNDAVSDWLTRDITGRLITWPDVASALCQWIVNGRSADLKQLSNQLWEQTDGGRTTPVNFRQQIPSKFLPMRNLSG